MGKTRVTEFDREPTTLTDEFGNVWTERYSVWSTNVGGIIRVEVAYENGSFKIRVADRTLKNKVKTAEVGRQRAIAYIKQQMRFLFSEVK